MTARYLYPRQRVIEMLAAMYAGGLGLYVGLTEALQGVAPLGWLQLSHDGQVVLAQALVTAALVHGLGIRINGAWWCSPFLRLGAMLTFLGVSLFAVWRGMGSSAGYTYGWVTMFLVIGAANAARDSFAAWKGEAGWKTI